MRVSGSILPAQSYSYRASLLVYATVVILYTTVVCLLAVNTPVQAAEFCLIQDRYKNKKEGRLLSAAKHIRSIMLQLL